MKRIALYILLILTALSINAKSLVDEADSAYIKKEYLNSIKLYEEVLAKEGISSDLLYNLGNAYYRAGKLGKAVLNYERALRLDAQNDEARNNLTFVKGKLTDKIPDSRNFISRVADNVVMTFSANTWAWISIIIFIALIGAILCYMFVDNVTYRKVGFFGGILLLFLEVLSLVISLSSASAANNHNYAIIIDESTMLSTTPRTPVNHSEEAILLHEGTKIEIIDSVATPNDSTSRMWYNVNINNNYAWIKSNAVEKI